jgi:hypothetical protein
MFVAGCDNSSDRLDYRPSNKNYYDSGELKSKMYDFMFFGYYVKYYKSGNIQIIYRTINGEFNGYSKELSESGEIIWEGVYEDSIRVYPHERFSTFLETDFTIEPELPDTITEQSDTIYFKIQSPYHLDDFTTFAQTAFHKLYKQQNSYSIIPFDTVPSGYIRIGAVNQDFTEWKFIDSVYLDNRKLGD